MPPIISLSVFFFFFFDRKIEALWMSVLYQTHQLLQTFNYSQFNSQVSWILKMVIVGPWGVQYSVNQWNPMGLVRDFLMHTMDLIKCVCVSLSLYIYINQIKQNLIYTWRENLILSYLNIVKYICPMWPASPILLGKSFNKP